jgi:predicted DCC family thiol-disulfide oxidoreductase YuxK
VRLSVVYDDECGFCRWCLAKVLAWDRRGALRPVALSTPEAARLLDGMALAERGASWHLVEPGGRVHSGGAAFAPLARRLPGGRPLAALAARFPRAAERAYQAVADHRTPIGRLIGPAARRRADRRIAERS